MNYFTPRRFPSLTVWFYASEEDDRSSIIDFDYIEANGEPLDDNLSQYLIETFGEDWDLELQELRF